MVYVRLSFSLSEASSVALSSLSSLSVCELVIATGGVFVGSTFSIVSSMRALFESSDPSLTSKVNESAP